MSFEQPNDIDPKDASNDSDFKIISKESFHEQEGLTQQEQYEEDLRNEIFKWIESRENLVGEGSNAEVFHPPSNPNVCCKLVIDREIMGGRGGIPDKYRRKIKTRQTKTPQHSLFEEGKYAMEIRDEGGLHKYIPDQFFCMELEHTDEGPKYFVKETIRILAMERLPATSIKDIEEGMSTLPKSFDVEDFMHELRSVVKKMHDAGIHHRDLHTGNVMVGEQDGKPYIIDFGTASRGPEHDVYTEDRASKEPIVYRKDEDRLNDIEKTLRKLQR